MVTQLSLTTSSRVFPFNFDRYFQSLSKVVAVFQLLTKLDRTQIFAGILFFKATNNKNNNNDKKKKKHRHQTNHLAADSWVLPEECVRDWRPKLFVAGFGEEDSLENLHSV